MDLGRTRIGIRTGLFKKSLEKKWGFGVVGGMSITYLKSLAPFQKFKLTSKLAGHYDGWFFIEQRFESKGKLVAAALVKVAFLRSGKKVMPEEMMFEMGVNHIGENQSYLELLFNSESEFLQFIKKDY
jgi:acyl-CoA thioesterase FadM